MSITLLCLVKGNTLANAFPVDIEKDQLVGHLKKVIKAEKQNDFAGIDADRLKLWNVKIPDDRDDLLSNFSLQDQPELLATRDIGDYWTEKPPKRHIHVIVKLPQQPPATTATSNCEQELLEENASLKEKLSKSEYEFDAVVSPKRKAPFANHVLPYTPRQRGIGGTRVETTEGNRVGNYEGIDLNSQDICKREQTIQKLVNKIYSSGFILVRSPPMSGKTSLGQLLEQHLVKDSNIRVIRISLLWMGNASGSWTFEEGFQRLMGITWEKFQEECVHIKTVFIVDEVQMLCVPQDEPMSASHHSGGIFWETIKGCQQVGNLYIIAFAAYGYKGAWDLSSATCTMDISPFMIHHENTWGIEDVRFTKDEYQDYFLRFCSRHLSEIKDNDDVTYLQEYVYNTTAGHPGLVAFFMNHIKNHFSRELRYDALTFKEIFLYLKSFKFMDIVNNSFRGYSHITNLTKEELDLCDRVFRGPIDTRLLHTSKKGIRLVKTNLLSEHNGKLDFASPYLRALYLQRRWKKKKTTRATATITPLDFKSFLRETFTNMNAEILRNSHCVGVDGRLLERAWQMEFYRAAIQSLPNDVFISPDVGTHFGSSGYIDFFVDDNHKWGIELLRDGQDASGHMNRFKDIYKPIRDACNEWVIIDIRNPELRHKAPEYEAGLHWINVYCQKDWNSVIIEDNNEKVPVQLMGGVSIQIMEEKNKNGKRRKKGKK